ncbi:DUF742 domain-containing protein [Streptomyces sp. 4N509B]|uniref:DUF742 domain-containing protein n=1 Tax=Streptomyces sp. 4N509B TaxID=3457413 RepID=UPI003FCF4EE2
MSEVPGDDDGPTRTEGPAVPLYVVTGGGEEDDSLVLDLVTLVVSRSAPSAGAGPEQAAILRMCRRPLSVAEISAHLDLPFSAVNLLVADLLAHRHVEVRQTRAEQELASSDPDLEMLKALIDGLQRL